MKFIFRLVLIILIAGSAHFLWQRYLVQKPAPIPRTPQLNLSSRTWANQNGRTFDGELVSAKADQVIIRRNADSLCFLIPKGNLSAEDQAYVESQINIAKHTGAFDAKVVPELHTLARKLSIKGYTTRIADSKSAGGWRTDRYDPVYWFFLSTKLHGQEAGEFWVRVNEVTYNAHKEGALLRDEHLQNIRTQHGQFSEKLSWPRPAVTIAEAQYGPKGVGFNVTGAILKHASEGRLPVEVQPDLFGLPPHLPALWELTIAWRTANGEIRQTIRDGSILTWP